MTSRERVLAALAHQQPDRVPLDIGGTGVTSMHCSIVYKLRQALGLDPPGTPVKVVEVFQMLGEVKPDLSDALGADVVMPRLRGSFFGFPMQDWKPWTTFDGTPVLVPGLFNTEPDPNGDILQYPQGDRSLPPSGRMPKGGIYFDAITRQLPIDESRLRIEDNLEEFGVISPEQFRDLGEEIDGLYRNTNKAVCAHIVSGTNFGDIAQVPAPYLKRPKGIRDATEWYMSLLTRPEFIRGIFERQCEIALENLKNFASIVGERIQVLFVSATDFGGQNGPLVSPELYCDLFKPFHARVNRWIHENTNWKTFMHCCGSIMPLIPHFIEAGFDILNPVQTSAANMGARELKERFGEQVVFWGGGIDTQRTLPFGTPDDVRREARERIRIFGAGGGFVFNTIHNIQAGTPIENLFAMFETIRGKSAVRWTSARQ